MTESKIDWRMEIYDCLREHNIEQVCHVPDAGHATLIRAPAELRSAVPVFQPQDPGLARLSQRLKEGFDPRGILNPGRMYPGV